MCSRRARIFEHWGNGLLSRSLFRASAERSVQHKPAFCRCELEPADMYKKRSLLTFMADGTNSPFVPVVSSGTGQEDR